jgi:hypothetical protein
MKTFITLYFGFLLISFIFYEKFSIDITFAKREYEESKNSCTRSKNEKECDLKFIYTVIENNFYDKNKKWEDKVMQSVNGEIFNLKNGERIDIKQYSQQLTDNQLNLFISQQKKLFIENDRQKRHEFISTLVYLSIRLSGAAGLMWILWKTFKVTAHMSFTSIMYIFGFISLILTPFTGITVVTAAAFFIIGWICDSNKN